MQKSQFSYCALVKILRSRQANNMINDKKFWKTIEPNFSSKKPINENISLWEKVD